MEILLQFDASFDNISGADIRLEGLTSFHNFVLQLQILKIILSRFIRSFSQLCLFFYNKIYDESSPFVLIVALEIKHNVCFF